MTNLHIPPPAGPPSLGLPASMWALPDGGDLRLCRLAMRGIALVHRGQLLHAADALPEDAPGLRLQLAAIPAALQAWAEEDGQAAAAGIPEMRQGSACSSAGGAAAPTAALVPAVEFSSVQQAVLAVQHWAWRRRPDRWGVERVCSTHLRGAACDTGPAAAGACCSWLRSCQLAKDAAPGELAAELAEAAAQSQAWLAAHEAALQALRPRWLQLGALFIE